MCHGGGEPRHAPFDGHDLIVIVDRGCDASSDGLVHVNADVQMEGPETLGRVRP